MRYAIPATIAALGLGLGLAACNQSAAPAADAPPTVVVAPGAEGPPGPPGPAGEPGATGAPAPATPAEPAPAPGSSKVTVEKSTTIEKK